MAIDTKVHETVAEKVHGRYAYKAEIVTYNEGPPVLSIGRYERMLDKNDEVVYMFRGRPAFDWEALLWLQEERVIEQAIEKLDDMA